MYTIMSTSNLFLIKIPTRTMSTMVFEPCVFSPLRPHDPANVSHKVNIKSFFTNRQINFCNFYVNIWSPCSSNTSIHHLFPICQTSAVVIGWSTKMRLTWLVDLELLRRIQVRVSGSICDEHISRAVVDLWCILPLSHDRILGSPVCSHGLLGSLKFLLVIYFQHRGTDVI